MGVLAKVLGHQEWLQERSLKMLFLCLYAPVIEVLWSGVQPVNKSWNASKNSEKV